MKRDKDNKEFNEAVDLISNTNQSIFLTGKAGAGKTTFLKYINDNIDKNSITLAPTGVAAINAGGVTINSFFQLPFGPFTPNDPRLEPENLFETFKYSKSKRAIIRDLELLIIDEVSMVRCDTIDVIDKLLRNIRRKQNDAFGGVQVLLIGDPYQLSPIANDNEWAVLSKYYDTPFFFGSKIFKSDPLHYVELKKIYRQTDQNFIDLLNRVRDGAPSDADIKLLNAKNNPKFYDDNYITLATHNNIVDEINAVKLAELTGATLEYSAVITGKFPDNVRPTDAKLKLKEGARVMFIKNDSVGDNYYNGKLGTIKKLAKNKITVGFDNGGEVSLKQEVWENLSYNHDGDTIESVVMGKFKQYPIRLAWAITVHKSQGLTFDKVVLDLSKAFTPGQVYVALSRCTSLDGIVLKSEVNPTSIKSEPKVLEFTKKYGELIK